MDISNVYATNQSSNTVSIFDRNISTGALSGSTTIAAGTAPLGIAISADGKNVYSANQNSNTVSIFNRNTFTGALSGSTTHATINNPYGICISADGKNVYTAIFNQDTVSMFDRDVTTGALSGSTPIATGTEPFGICISADGKNVYATNSGQSNVSIFVRDVTNGELSGSTTIPSLSQPYGICISADGKNVYVANSGSNTVSIFDRNISTGALSGTSVISTGSYPNGITISADGYNVYVTNVNDNTVSIFTRNVSTGALSGSTTIAAGTYPIGICISADGKSVYVTNQVSNNVSIFDRNVSTGVLTANSTIATGSTPFAIAVFDDSVFPEPTALMIDVEPYGVVSGDPFTTQPIIKIVDSNGDVFPTATNDVEVEITVVNGSGSLTGTTTVTAVDGYATFTDLVFTGAGSFYLTFTSTGLTPVNSNEIATLTPTELVVYVQPFASISGQLLSTQPTVKIVNWLGDLVPDATDVVDVSLVDVTGSSILTGTLNATASGGYSVFTDLIATGYGSFYLTFTSGTLTSVNSDTLFFTPDAGNPNPPIPVKPKRSYIPLSVPTSGDMETNEFAINVADKKGYVRDSNGIIHQVFDGNAIAGGVTSIIAGTGINIDNSTGNVTISAIASAPSLEQLTDVQITSKTDGQLLRYFAPTQKWVNSNIVDGGNF